MTFLVSVLFIHNVNDIQCIGVIIDGNRRWAKKRGLASMRGHEAGSNKLKEFLDWAREAGVRHVIAYVFSTENWHRSRYEVAYLMRLINRFFTRDLAELKKKKIRVRIAGDRSMLSRTIQGLVERAERETAFFKDFTLALALSYGGRDEIVAAANALLALRSPAKLGEEGLAKKRPSDALITKEEFASHLWTAGIPDPDLIIRTSGETRLSNFLPWQSVYSELFFLPAFWPDLTKEEFLRVLDEYRSRQRRFGK